MAGLFKKSPAGHQALPQRLRQYRRGAVESAFFVNAWLIAYYANPPM